MSVQRVISPIDGSVVAERPIATPDQVEAVLRRRRSLQPLEYADLKLDLTRRFVWREGRSIDLSPREFDLLRHFVQNPGRVFTREQLMQRIWGEDYFGTPRTIDNFIARLRGKIELNPDAPQHLETVRGVGYRYNP